MNENASSKKRDWVKNAAIIFLSVMLVLTFFSNTIMNYSLPEVATQYVQSGTITAKVRGTGNVEATDPYNIIAKETRVIAGVAVKQGDEVKKGDILYYLEDAESDELNKAEEELTALELAYMKGLFGAAVSPDVISKVSSGRTDSFATFQAKVTDMQNRIKAAEARVKECTDAVSNLTKQKETNSNNATINTLPEENAKAEASSNLENAQAAATADEASFNKDKAAKVAALTQEISQLKSEISDLQTLIDKTVSSVGNTDNGTGGTGGGGTVTGTTGGIQELKDKKKATEAEIEKAKKAIVKAKTGQDTDISNFDSILEEVKSDESYKTLISDYNIALAQDEIVGKLLKEALENLGNYDNLKEQLSNKQSQLISREAKLAEVNAITFSSGDGVKSAQQKLNEATKNLTDKTNSNKATAVGIDNQLSNANTALKNAQTVLDILKEEQTKLSADINAELDLSKANKDIATKKEQIKKIREKTMGAAVTSPVDGFIMSLAHVTGESTKPEETIAVIQVSGKGYTLSFSVTNEQAKKVQAGDTAEIQNSWYYEDVKAILTAIKPDKDNPGQKKMLVFDVTGASIQAGQALSLSVGQRSADYELVVPNSAVREDNNGKFILTVESKSSPLGNRYFATRVDVEVLASDDNNTAVSGALYGYEYVVTTSTKPVEAGKQVRLNES